MSLAGIRTFFADVVGVFTPEQERTAFAPVDFTLIGVLFAMLGFGLIMVYSATLGSMSFLIRQLIWICIGLVAALFIFRVPLEFWQKISPFLWIVAVAALIAMFIPGLGIKVKGAVRWIGFGPLRVQPAEFVKLMMIVFAAGYCIRRYADRNRLKKGFLPILGVLALIAGALLVQKDLGSLFVIIAVTFAVIFIGGFSLVWLSGLVVGAGALVTIAIALEPFRLGRFKAFLDPWAKGNVESYGYQLVQSLISVGQGELFGKGLGAGVGKLKNLPEAHTDFIMAVIGEELGLAGVIVFLIVMYWLVRRAIEIGRKAIVVDMVFEGLVAQGIGIWLAVQTIVHVGVVMGMLPTKGLTLPFISYGGSSLVMACMAMGLLLRIDADRRRVHRG